MRADQIVLQEFKAAECDGLHHWYQANTVTSKRVLSWARLGREVWLRIQREARGCLPRSFPRELTLEHAVLAR